MYDSYITFRSLTAAQRALAACQNQGLPVRLGRAPKQLSSRGCGYALEVPGPSCYRAVLELRLEQIPFAHVFETRKGRLEEVFL